MTLALNPAQTRIIVQPRLEPGHLLGRRYSFITAVSSKEGVSRILKLKGVSNGRKPLSLLCRDLATIQEYALGIDKTKYKMLRSYLPGPKP